MLRLVWRAVLLVLALVFIASAVLVALAVVALWLLQNLWARLTGRPVAPMRVYSAGASWRDMMRTVDRFAPKPRQPGTPGQAEVVDVTDVEVKKISPP